MIMGAMLLSNYDPVCGADLAPQTGIVYQEENRCNETILIKDYFVTQYLGSVFWAKDSLEPYDINVIKR